MVEKPLMIKEGSQPMPPILVLAGGRATRLKNLSIETPKYLMPINKNQVFADIHLSWLASLGLKEVILSIGYLGDKIKDFCGDGNQWGLKISYLEDGPSLLGTGGAVRKSLAYDFENLCITYGDTLLKFNLVEFLERFYLFKKDHGGMGAMTIYKNVVPGHVCNIDWKMPFLVYDKQNPNSNWEYIDYGFMVLTRKLIKDFEAKSPLDLSEPLSLASHKNQIMGFPVSERFWEIGSPEALSEFQNRLNR